MLKYSQLLWSSLLVVLCCLSFVKADQKVSINIPSFAKECIYNNLDNDDHALIINYQVLQGGNFELDFEITSPKGETIIKQTNEKYADFLLKTFGLGEYTFCFSNPYNTLKKVEFSIEYENKENKERLSNDKDSIVSEHSLSEIDRNVVKIAKIMDYLRAREWRNMSTVQSTESRMVYLSIGIIVLMVAISFGQVTIVQFLFEGRTKTYV